MRSSRLAAILLAHSPRGHSLFNFQSVRKASMRDISVSDTASAKGSVLRPLTPDESLPSCGKTESDSQLRQQNRFRVMKTKSYESG